MKKQIEQELKSRELQVAKVESEQRRRELRTDIENVRKLINDDNKESAGVFLLKKITSPTDVSAPAALSDEMLTLSLLFVQSLLQGWAFKSLEFKNWIEKLKETEVSKLLNEIIQKQNPERFGLPGKSTDTQSNDLKKATHSILASNHADLIAKSSIIDLEIQKSFIFFFSNLIKENVNPNISLHNNKDLFAGYCYSIILNESLLTSDDQTEKAVLLKMFNNAHSLFEKASFENYAFNDIGTGIPLNLKSCMNLCRIILTASNNGANEKAIDIVKSQLFELQKTDPNNPYITYFNIITLEKRAKQQLIQFSNGTSSAREQAKIEESLTQCLNLCTLLEKMLKRYSVKKSSAFSFIPIPFRIASIHSLYIDYYSKIRENGKVQQSAKKIVEQLNVVQTIFNECPPRISNKLIEQSIYLRMRANFYLRNHQETDETFKNLFALRHLCEFDPCIVNCASFYLAGRTVLKCTSEAIPYLQELESEHPESLDLKLLLINSKDFSLENSLVTKELIHSIVENYKQLEAQIQKEKPKNAQVLLFKIKTRLQFLENLLLTGGGGGPIESMNNK